MLSMLRDLPFIDSIFPVLVAALLWTGAHVYYVGPEVVAPRLAEKYYLPACRAHVAKAQARLSEIRRERTEAAEHAKRRKQEAVRDALTGMMTGILGDEYMRHYGDHPFFKSMKDITELGITLQNPVEALTDIPRGGETNPADYCGCVVAELLGGAETGFFSASLRFWKPGNIRRLERIDRELIRSDLCGAPKLS